MSARAANLYRRVHLESAKPSQVLDELFGALLTDVQRAAEAIRGRDSATKGTTINHALKIVAELQAALDHDVAPDLCRSLSALYNFVSYRLTRASMKLEIESLLGAEKVIVTLRDAFRDAARSGY